jgi:hypothetical protein
MARAVNGGLLNGIRHIIHPVAILTQINVRARHADVSSRIHCQCLFTAIAKRASVRPDIPYLHDLVLKRGLGILIVASPEEHPSNNTEE